MSKFLMALKRIISCMTMATEFSERKDNDSHEFSENK